MNRTKTLALGALTLWPLAYVILFMGMLAYMALFLRNEPPRFIGFVVALHLLTMAELAGLLIFYIVHLFRTSAVPNDKKALWAVVLFMGSVLAMPVYWYLYLWTPETRP